MWIENARRVMPKGRLLPVPLLCTLTVGAPLKLAPRRAEGRVRRAHAQRAARADAARRMTPAAADLLAVRRRRRGPRGRVARRLRRSRHSVAQGPAARDDRQPQRADQGVVGDGAGDRPRVPVRQHGRDPAVPVHLVRRAARVHDAHVHAQRRLPGARRRASSSCCRCSTLLVYVGWYGLYSIFIPVYVFLLLPILEVAGGDTKRFLERTAKMQWGLMICVFCISHVPALLTLDIPGYEDRNLLLIAFLVHRRAVERRAAVRVGQALRQAQGRARGLAVQDRRRASSAASLSRDRAGRVAVVDHAVQRRGRPR